jgi:hypothetical protein
VNAQDQSNSAMAEGNKSGTVGREKEQTPNARNWDQRTTMLSLLLMAMATLGSSWSAYQASLWNGVQTFRLVDAAAASRAADEKRLTSNQLRTLEASLFVEFARDLYEGKIKLSEFLLARMRPEMREAVRAWMATEPLKNPRAPSTPFVMPQYRAKMDDEARELEAKSAATYNEAQKANRTSDIYAMAGVLFTAALFLAGLVSGFDQRLARQIILAMSLSMLIIALLIMARQPVTHPG